MGITSLASIDLHRSAEERSRLFAVSGVRLLLSSCGSELRPNHHWTPSRIDPHPELLQASRSVF